MTIRSGHVMRELLRELKRLEKNCAGHSCAHSYWPKISFSLRNCARGHFVTGGKKLTAKQSNADYGPRHAFSFEFHLPAGAKNVEARLSNAIERAFLKAEQEFVLQEKTKTLKKMIRRIVGDVYTHPSEAFSKWTRVVSKQCGHSPVYANMTEADVMFWADAIRNKFGSPVKIKKLVSTTD